MLADKHPGPFTLLLGSRQMHPKIEPLLPEVAAQIKTAIVINRLSDVVLGLLQNSLDAGATNVDVTVDFTRGNCVVDDDGAGIPEEEFQSHGNLGQAYCTSKTQATNVYGTAGNFLASLASLSLLNITSKHERGASAKTVFLRHSKRISDRATWHNQLLEPLACGTRVVVRNLFWNMPVRRKHRALLEEQGADQKEWRSLGLIVASLMLSWHQPFTILLRDERGARKFAVVDRQARLKTSKSPPTAFNAGLVLNVLTQASIVDSKSRLSFIPVSGATNTIKIEGLISTDPSPTKEKQFISLGIEPIWRDGQHNELFETVNRVFANSDFGEVPDDFDTDGSEQTGCDTTRHFKINGKSNKQPQIRRKGIDRWPMFYLRITLWKPKAPPSLSWRVGAELQEILHNVTELLEAISVQWLTKQHLRPQKSQTRTKNIQSNPSRPRWSWEIPSLDACVSNSKHMLPRRCEITSEAENRTEGGRPQTQPGTSSFDPISILSPQRSKSAGEQSFNTFSRVKSSALVTCVPALHSKVRLDAAILEPKSDLQLKRSGEILAEACFSDDTITDVVKESFPWQDPVTKVVLFVDAMSGATMPVGLPGVVSCAAQEKPRSALVRNSAAVSASQVSPSRNSTSWIDDILTAWDNPVFRPSETQIAQTALDLPAPEGTLKLQLHGACAQSNVLKSIDKVGGSTFEASNLSIIGLQNANVIAQLDKKFLLVKLPDVLGAQQDGRSGNTTGSVLALIDQHAADERCKVESLFRDFALSTRVRTISTEKQIAPGLDPFMIVLHEPIIFSTTTEESVLLRENSAFFARWGISYNIFNVGIQPASTGGSKQVKVTALPKGIAERCASEPYLLINLIRGEIWKEDKKRSHHSSPVSDETRQNHEWLREIGGCPQGILDMLISRACRSAIMFNDILDRAQCETLLSALAATAFPFQCAHGRPSMVPLMNIENNESSEGIGLQRIGSDSSTYSHEDNITISFTDKFKHWHHQTYFTNSKFNDATRQPSTAWEVPNQNEYEF